MSDGLCVRRALDRTPSRLSQIIDSALGQPSLDQVMRQKLGLGFGGLREEFLEGLGDVAMKLPLFVANQGAVSGIPDQRVLENIDRIRRFAPDKYQLYSRQLGESGMQTGA